MFLFYFGNNYGEFYGFLTSHSLKKIDRGLKVFECKESMLIDDAYWGWILKG